MKRKFALIMSCLLIFVGMCGCTDKNDISGITVPKFEESEGVQFVAYGGPTVENWNGVAHNVNTLTDEHYQKLAEAGFTKVLALYEGASYELGSDVYDTIKKKSAKAASDAMRALALAEKYGLQYYVRDWSFYGLSKITDDEYYKEINSREAYEKVLSEMFGENNEYIKSPAYCGNFGDDEPSIDQLERIKWQAELFKEYTEKAGVENAEMLVNLNPNYVGESSLGSSYREYIDKYFELCAPLLKYVCFDYYPLRKDNTKGSLLRTTYLANLEMLANKCKGTDVDLRAFIQVVGDFTGTRDMTGIADIRFQVYTEMAFGVKQITYYQYGNWNDQEDGGFALLDLSDGTYNWTYDLAKKVNNEVHKMEDAYLHYDYDGIMCFSSLGEGVINTNFRSVEHKMTSHPRIASVENEQDAIIGTFKDDDGNDAFMLVNYTDPYFDLDNRVTIKFNDAKALLMYRFGEQVIVPLDSDGSYTFVLYPGEGRFIIPLK